MRVPRVDETFDVIIIGAGAAGIAAAARLAGASRSVMLLEARERVGGRCWTLDAPGLASGIELGAEFIHGTPAGTLAALKSAGFAAAAAGDQHWFAERGRLVRGRPFAELRNAMRRSALLDERDLSFAAYLRRASGGELTPDAVAVARRMVEGFDAADARRISARAVFDEWTDPAASTGEQSRPLGGYAAFMQALAARASAAGCRLRMHSAVDTVHWGGGRVVVGGTRYGRRFTFAAAQTVVTLPLGVLQQRAPRGVRFIPVLNAKRDALHALSAGVVLKLVLQFRAPFWESLARGRYRDAAFFHAARAPFRTMWTAMPARVPLLTAWAGGPPARKLLALGRPALLDRALKSVEAVFGPRAGARAQFENAWLHDWQHDPYTRGAYSYVNAGGEGARAALAAPLGDTLFFAGEAAETGGESGTVAAALASGERAAAQVIAVRSTS